MKNKDLFLYICIKLHIISLQITQKEANVKKF